METIGSSNYANATMMGFSLAEATQSLDFWRDFDMDNRRLALDKACIEMKEMKTNSINARKRLNDITKNFRGKTKDEQMSMINDILHDYQEEIDQLSRRAKFSENAFYGLYKALYEAPDPAELIGQMINVISNSSTHQLEIERLRAELSQYDEEFQQLKNQDITIRRLEEQIQEFKTNIEDKVKEAVIERSREVEESADARINEMREVQRGYERRLAAALESLRQAQQSADRAQSQLFEVSSQAESRISGLQAENTILAEGTHRSNLRIAELERSLELLQSSQSRWKISSQTSAGQPAQVDSTDQQALQEMLVADLRADCQRKDELLRSMRAKNESMMRDVSTQLTKERETISQLRQELAERPSMDDYLSVKQQLKVLQRLVFNIQDDAEDASHPEITQLSASSDKVQFEMMLTMKLKTMETELAETRRLLSESREQEKLATNTVTSLKSSLDASTALVQRLEADLELRTSASGRTTTKGLAVGPIPDSTLGLAELLSDTTPSMPGKKASVGEGQQQLVTILQAQRDRYKEKLGQVESSLMYSQQQLEAVNTAKTQLEADNLSLYGKIRFLQSYSQGVNTMNIRASRFYRDNQADEEYGMSTSNQQEVEQRYQQLYEQGMSPFQEFSRFEKQRKLNELTVADRIVLNTTMAVVSSHTGRSLLLVYLALMHLLVFVTLYYSAHYVHYGCDPAIDHLIHQHRQDLLEKAVIAANTIAASKH